MQFMNHWAILGKLENAGLIAICMMGVIWIGMLGMIVSCFRKVEKGTAIVRTGMRGTMATFTGTLIFPVIERAEVLDIKLRRIEVELKGREGVGCKDFVKGDIVVAFFVRVNDTEGDVIRVATQLGCKKGSDIDEIDRLFRAKFTESIKIVGKQFDFMDLYENRERFRDKIIETVGSDLHGFILDDCAIDYLEQTPLEDLDPNNILDAEAIKKITEAAAQQSLLVAEIERDKEKTLAQMRAEDMNVAANERPVQQRRPI